MGPLTYLNGKKEFCRFAAIWAMILILAMAGGASANEEDVPRFDIHSFYIEGNSMLKKEVLTMGVKNYVGKGKTAQDVELARDALEKLYHELGYPTVLVNIPEQTVDDGIIKLQVIESRIKRVWVEGNSYFTMEYIKDNLSSVQPGEILFLPEVKKELARMNRNPDLKVSPLLIPGRELGTIDVELKVEDSLPLHGSLELNNRASHKTSELRLNGVIHYDNLWQKGHGIHLQFQTSPLNVNEVKAGSVAYAMPAPWNREHMLMGYYIYADSETASGEGFDTIGEGEMVGMRYMFQLPPMGSYYHNMSVGFDYKNFKEESLGYEIPVAYTPFNAAYTATRSDSTGQWEFTCGLNFLFRDIFGNDTDEFEAKRYGATGNYIVLKAGAKRRQKLPVGSALFVQLDGQVADQPLISNEQYSAGGANSVRGYKESEIQADNSLHGTFELFAPKLREDRPMILPYVFYDWAWLSCREALAGEYGETFIHGTGVGVQGTLIENVDYKLDWAFALKDTDDTQSGESFFYFKVKWRF